MNSQATASFAHPRKIVQACGLKAGDWVADLGAGAGHMAFELADIVGEDGRVVAVDIQKELVSKVRNEAERRGLSNIEVIWSDLERPEGSTLKDESVEAVMIANVLFQISNKEALAREAYRIVKASGSVVVVDWSDSHGGLGPKPEDVVKKERTQEIFESVGFRTTQVLTPGAHHYGFIFRKTS